MDVLFLINSFLVLLPFWYFKPSKVSVFLIPLVVQLANAILTGIFLLLAKIPWFSKYNLPSSNPEWLTIKNPPFLPQIFLSFANHFLVTLCYFLFVFPDRLRSSEETYFIFFAWHVIVETLLCYCLYEVLQTLFHRLMHLPWWFLHFHRLHHLTFADASYTGFFMHPVDLFAQVIIPTFILTLYVCTCAESVLLFFLLGVTYSHTGHSGYAVPGFFSGAYHEIHHRDMTRGFAPLLEFLIGKGNRKNFT
jgi:sterol desaturase/sphingolipid hydroxylase (fatty acid hydroxylase superfamily)